MFYVIILGPDSEKHISVCLKPAALMGQKRLL